MIIVLISGFSSSYNSLNIDNSAFVSAIGIDKGTNNILKITFQFISPTPSTEGGSKTEPIINSVECSSIINGINMINAFLGRKANLSHCKLIIFSEELAKEGILDKIYSLINEVQIRPSANIVISKCNTAYYIKNSKPEIESLIPDYYEIFPNTSEYTGYTCDATIGNFFNSLISNTHQAYAILGGINTNENKTSLTDNNIKSNETQIKAIRKSENIGLAVFKDDKLIGELNAIETICFMNLENKVKNFLISIKDPQKDNSYVDIYLSSIKKPKIKIQFINASAYIKIDFSFLGKINSMNEDSKYLDKNVLNSLSTSCNNYLKEEFTKYLYKTSLEYNSDINNFGSYACSNFLTTKKFIDYNWLENYKNSSFEININTTLDSGSLLTQT